MRYTLVIVEHVPESLFLKLFPLKKQQLNNMQTGKKRLKIIMKLSETTSH